MKLSSLTSLSERAKVAFFSEIEARETELLTMRTADALSAIHDEIGTVIDTFLDERSDDYTQMLLLCCLECPDLFTTQPGSLSCITQNESRDQVNAQHCVYHNLYDLLRSTLENEFEAWHQERVVSPTNIQENEAINCLTREKRDLK
jgi:hypothetical protein